MRGVGKSIYCTSHGTAFRRDIPMLDLLMLALGLGFFVLSIGYAYACERL
jgi:hypothetical protein